MFIQSFDSTSLEDAWIDGEDSARWRSAAGHGPDGGAVASGSSLLEVGAGCRLPQHTDSAEETIVVLAGEGVVTVAEEKRPVRPGAIVLVPAGVPHDIRNAGGGPLRFVAVYADTDVVTTYEDEVQPDGSRERRPLG